MSKREGSAYSLDNGDGCFQQENTHHCFTSVVQGASLSRRALAGLAWKRPQVQDL